MSIVLDSFEEAKKKFLDDEFVEEMTTCKVKFAENPVIAGQEITRIRKNKDGSVSFYNGREKVEERPDNE